MSAPFGWAATRRGFEDNTMRTFLKSFIDDDSGATAIEYALLASMMAVMMITILTSLGGRLSTEFSEVSAALK